MADRLLADTCAWIEFLKGEQTPLAEALEQSLVQGRVVTCGVVMYELIQGIGSPREEALVLNAFQAVPQVDLTQALWVKAGRLSAKLRKQGTTLPLTDILVAILALEHGLVVLTRDQHFSAIPGLAVTAGV
jgi:predicted nucleic acid-binding protein